MGACRFVGIRAPRSETREMGTVGTSKPRRKRRLGALVLTFVCLTVGLALLPMSASAVHDINVFELDGNAVDNSAGGPPDDWGTLFPTSTSTTVLASEFVTDSIGSGDEGWGSGLTKDTNDIPNWTWVTGSVSPPKDNIAHAYAAT